MAKLVPAAVGRAADFVKVQVDCAKAIPDFADLIPAAVGRLPDFWKWSPAWFGAAADFAKDGSAKRKAAAAQLETGSLAPPKRGEGWGEGN